MVRYECACVYVREITAYMYNHLHLWKVLRLWLWPTWNHASTIEFRIEISYMCLLSCHLIELLDQPQNSDMLKGRFCQLHLGCLVTLSDEIATLGAILVTVDPLA